MSEIENFETHLDRMEREAQKQASDLRLEQERTKRAKIEARKETKEAITIVSVVIVVAATIVALLTLWWVAVRGPGAKDVQRQQEIQLCFDKGGVWAPDKGDYRDDDFVAEHCSMPKDD